MADIQATAAQEWISSMLSHLGLDISVKTDLPESVHTHLQQFGGSWLTLETATLDPDQVQTLIGDRGQVLDAMQYLTNATLNLGQDAAEQVAYTVEISGYREKRYLQLAQLAEDAAQQVRSTGAEVEMAPLPPAERRLIHTILGDVPDLKTYSRGEGAQRRLVVGPSSIQNFDET